METLSRSSPLFVVKTYFLLTKPGIILGNIVNAAGGFVLASKGYMNFWLFLTTVIGLSLIIASGCVFNNYIDRDLDEKMTRTKNRAMARGIISTTSALIFAIVLMLFGSIVLALFTNFLAFAIAIFGLFVYVILYTFLKYRSVHGTLIGSIAGAVPPVVGYCAVNNRLDLGALILFTMIALWQMPHFFAIAIYRFEDFSLASIPVLPIKKGIHITKIQMTLYIIAFIAASLMLKIFNYTGYAYLIVMSILGLVWLGLCIKGFKCKNNQFWARKVFRFSLVVVLVLFFMISFNTS